MRLTGAFTLQETQLEGDRRTCGFLRHLEDMRNSDLLEIPPASPSFQLTVSLLKTFFVYHGYLFCQPRISLFPWRDEMKNKLLSCFPSGLFLFCSGRCNNWDIYQKEKEKTCSRHDCCSYQRYTDTTVQLEISLSRNKLLGRLGHVDMHDPSVWMVENEVLPFNEIPGRDNAW